MWWIRGCLMGTIAVFFLFLFLKFRRIMISNTSAYNLRKSYYFILMWRGKSLINFSISVQLEWYLQNLPSVSTRFKLVVELQWPWKMESSGQRLVPMSLLSGHPDCTLFFDAGRKLFLLVNSFACLNHFKSVKAVKRWVEGAAEMDLMFLSLTVR